MTTREDRERAAEHEQVSGHPFAHRWVATGISESANRTQELVLQACERLADAFAAHREAAVRAERERIEREFDRQWNDEHQVSVLAIRRIVRGEAKGGE